MILTGLLPLLKRTFHKQNAEDDKIYIKDKGLIVVDGGASFYKVVGYNGAKADFQNSVEVIDARTSMYNANVLTINGNTYLTSNGYNSMETLKHKKDYLPLVLKGITQIDNQVNIPTNSKGIKEIRLIMLVPDNQVKFIDNYTSTINGTYTVTTNSIAGARTRKYKVTLMQLCVEGYSSYLSLGKKVINNMKYCLTMNIGCSTFDVSLIDCRTNSIIGQPQVVNRGSRQLMEQLINVLTLEGYTYDDELMVQNLFINKNPVLKKCEKPIEDCMYKFFDGLMHSIRALFLNTPWDAEILIVGGTANIMRKAIEKWFKNSEYDFKIRFLSEENSRFADAIGAYRLASGEFTEKGSIPFDETQNESYEEEKVQEVQVQKSTIEPSIKNEPLKEEKVQSSIVPNESTNIIPLTPSTSNKGTLSTTNKVHRYNEKGITGTNINKNTTSKKVQLNSIKSTNNSLESVPTDVLKLFPNMTNHEKILELKKLGYKQKQVAQVLGVSESLVKKRWNQPLKDK